MIYHTPEKILVIPANLTPCIRLVRQCSQSSILSVAQHYNPFAKPQNLQFLCVDSFSFTEFNRYMALNNGDLKQIRVIMREELDNQEEKFEIKITEVKSEFFKKIDPILKEVTTAREERPLIENRLEALEEIHPKGKHLPAS